MLQEEPFLHQQAHIKLHYKFLHVQTVVKTISIFSFEIANNHYNEWKSLKETVQIVAHQTLQKWKKNLPHKNTMNAL